MYQEIDPSLWKRKDAYNFYKEFDDPLFDLVVDVDVTDLYAQSKKMGISFFLACLYQSIRITNELETFRYRIENEQLRLYDKIHGASTILLEDETFRFCFFEHHQSLENFAKAGAEAIEAEKKRSVLNPQKRLDIIHYSVIPWVSFRALKHAYSKAINPSIPKIVFGKFYKENDRLKMPISAGGHHALMDGFHLGQYFNAWNNLTI